MIATVIAETTANSGVLPADKITDLGYNDLVENYVVTDKRYVLSLLLEGRFKPYYAYPPINDPELITRLPLFINAPTGYGKLLLIGDADIVNEVLWNGNSGDKHNIFDISYSSDNLLFLRNVLDYMSGSVYTNVGKKKNDEDKINLVDVFSEWSKNFYQKNKQKVSKDLFDVKTDLMSIRSKKTEFDLLSVKKLKDEEKLIRKEMDLNHNLRKIAYLTGEKYKFFMMCFSMALIIVVPLLIVLLMWQIYAIYNRRLMKKAKEYIND